MLHDVGLLEAAVKLDRITTACFAAGAGFIIFMWPLRGILFGVSLRYFTLLRGVSGVMKQACVIQTSNLLAWRDHFFCLALAIATLLGVGRRGGLSSLSVPGMTVTVGIFPLYFLEGVCSSYTCSAISIHSNMAQVSLKVFI